VFCLFQVRFIRFALFVIFPLAANAAPWDPVSPADLKAADRSALDPEAPAEAIFRRIDVDDSNFPEDRTVTIYSRYRIFDPEKATNLTRISEQSISYFGEQTRGDAVMRARLTLPDGTVHEFGNEAIRERTLVQAGAERSWMARIFGPGPEVESSEKFLAVTGIVAGALLEIQRSHHERRTASGSMIYVANLQQYIAPTRRLDFAYHATENDNWQGHPITLNGPDNHAIVQADPRHRIVKIEARDVPALYHEPLSVPLPSYALTFVIAYHQTQALMLSHHFGNQNYRVNNQTDPWGFYATAIAMLQDDLTYPPSTFKRLAKTITAAAPDDLTRAKLIHQYVQTLFHRYAVRPRPGVVDRQTAGDISSVLQLVEFEKHPDLVFQPNHFVFLEVALDRALGLSADTVMLPNLNFVRFDERLVGEAYLPVFAARVRVGEGWDFSLPTTEAPLAFNSLPWPNEGQEGLLAQPIKQVFVPVPATTAEQSQIVSAGEFNLSSSGLLSGGGTQTFTGHHAEVRRAQVRRFAPERVKRWFAERLQSELKGANVRVVEVQGARNPEVPLVVSFRLNWPDFALVTKDRLIFHPSIFHFNQTAPFTAPTRRYAFQFPFRYAEADRLKVAIPEGYTLESKQAPAAIPGNDLSYRCEISQEKQSKKIRFTRGFTMNLQAVPADSNSALLEWYRHLTDCDTFELVLRRPAAETAPAETETP